jgi:hypothetical protein
MVVLSSVAVTSANYWSKKPVYRKEYFYLSSKPTWALRVQAVSSVRLARCLFCCKLTNCVDAIMSPLLVVATATATRDGQTPRCKAVDFLQARSLAS